MYYNLYKIKIKLQIQVCKSGKMTNLHQINNVAFHLAL